MRDRRWLWKPIALGLVLFIQGCSSSDETEPAGESLAAEEEYDLAVSGSVGDGPAANALIRVISKTGEVLATGIGNATASYDVEVKTKGKHYPLTIEASGGVDLISGLPLDFLLTSTVSSPRNTTIAHINPYTTLAIATARQTSIGLSAQTVATAIDSIAAEFNLGMTSAISLDPLTVPIDDSNLAEIIKSAEGLAEIFRRVAAAATRAGFSASIDTVIDAIGADLVDGKLDGSGAAGTNRRISAITLLIEAQVAAELMRNELRVNGRIATATLDDIVRMLASGQAPELTESRPVNAHLVHSLLDGIDAASELGNAGSLDAIRDGLAGLQSGATAETARLVVPSMTAGELSGPIGQVAAGSEAEFSLVLATSANELVASNSPPFISGTPVISGTPATSVVAGFTYAFTPTVSDADGDTLTFTIQNQPSWASFSSSTGQLSGVPGAGDIGIYASISISVSDGKDSVNLPAFSIAVDAIALGTATLSWEAPTTNVDGSPLDNLAGYEIAWGGASGNYPNSVTVMNPGITSYVVENLANGTHFFAVKSISASGLKSTFSNEASKTIP